MQKFTIDRRQTGAFSAFTNDFIYEAERFSDLIEAPFSLESMKKQIVKKGSFSEGQRLFLFENLKNQ